MAATLLRRNVANLAEETLADTPVTVITGARQVGKSTLMQQLIADKNARVVNLDRLAERQAAQEDPDGFAAQFPQGTLAIDEVQRVPELLTSIKAAVDADRRPGRLIVTGSADLLSLRGAQESLAGRAQTIHLEAFSQDELRGQSADFAAFAWSLSIVGTPVDRVGYTRRDYLDLAMTPAFPELRSATESARSRWLTNYVDRVLSKDSTDITGIQYPDRLETLLNLIAAKNAGEFVAANVGREIDIPARSVPTYMRALRSIYLIRVLSGWSNNVANRAVSIPKVCVADTGLAAHLAEVDADGLEVEVSSTVTGGLLEGFVVGELSKQAAWTSKPTRMFHYRDDHKREVDIVLEDRRRNVVGIEVKATTSPGKSAFRGLEYLRNRAGNRFIAGIVLHTGQRSVPFGDRLWALPMATIWDH